MKTQYGLKEKLKNLIYSGYDDIKFFRCVKNNTETEMKISKVVLVTKNIDSFKDLKDKSNITFTIEVSLK